MNRLYIIISSLIACMFLYLLEQIIKVDYITKTLLKITLFILVPYIYIRFVKKSTIREFIGYRKIGRHHLKLGFLFGMISFFIVLVTYFLMRSTIDLQGIAQELQVKSKVTPENFIFIGLYITIGNSFLEEFFFRGFIFLNLFKLENKRLAYLYSSLLFAMYHISIFKTWFNIWLVGLALFGLVVIGLIFDWLDTKSENFINSWLVHILADCAVIIVGLKMFNLI